MNPSKVIQAALRFQATKRSWLGDGGVPVAQELAQSRANVCLACPQNKQHTVWELFTAPAVADLHRQLKLKDQMKLHVDGEAKLHVCETCWCVLATKVHVPLQHILAGQKPEDMPENCWIRKESIA